MRWMGHFSVVPHTGNFHRKGYIMLHHLACATIQVANLVNLIAILQEDGNIYAADDYVKQHSENSWPLKIKYVAYP